MRSGCQKDFYKCWGKASLIGDSFLKRQLRTSLFKKQSWDASYFVMGIKDYGSQISLPFSSQAKWAHIYSSKQETPVSLSTDSHRYRSLLIHWQTDFPVFPISHILLVIGDRTLDVILSSGILMEYQCSFHEKSRGWAVIETLRGWAWRKTRDVQWSTQKAQSALPRAPTECTGGDPQEETRE